MKKQILTVEPCDINLVMNAVKSYITQTGKFPKGKWTKQDISAIK